MSDRRLIEDSMPLAKISEYSAKEKNIRHGHISTLHIWWARRPLAAARAAILGAILPAPKDDKQRDEMHSVIVRGCSWENIKSPSESRLLRNYLEQFTGGQRPKLLDPFSGGGAIPLEGIRLGLDVVANDLNPIAYLLERCTLEFPQRFATVERPVFASSHNTMTGSIRGESLALDFEYWAQTITQRADLKLAEAFASKRKRDRPLAYLWVRTLLCGNPECRGTIPLIKQYWVSKKKNLSLIPSFKKKDFKFRIDTPPSDLDPSSGTIKRDKVSCPYCNQVTSGKELRKAGENRWPERLVAVFKSSGKTRMFEAPSSQDRRAFENAQSLLEELEKETPELIPNEKLPYLRSIFNVHVYGIQRWRDLFNDRQLLTVATLVNEVGNAYSEMISSGVDRDYADAISAYLALLVDRVADYSTVICRWDNSRDSIANTFSRQALGMVWDYAEVAPLAGGSGSIQRSVDWIARVIRHTAHAPIAANVVRGSATRIPEIGPFDIIITDPPYYDAVPYADLSDFFYVWAKRCLVKVFPELFATELTPKREEAVQLAERNKKYAYKTKERFEDLLTESFKRCKTLLSSDGLVGVMFAHKSTSAWETLLSSLLQAGLVVTASWPLDTEMTSRLRGRNSAALASSVLIVCRQRKSADDGFIDDVEPALQTRLHERLDYFWSQGIRGADFFMSAIGPAVEVFGCYKRVLELSGAEVTVGALLDKVRAIVADYALQRIVQGERAGDVDEISRFYVLWRWAFGASDVDSGEAIHMAQSMGCEFDELIRPGSVLTKKKDKVSLAGPVARKKRKGLGDPDETGAHAPLIDVLHRAANLWSAGDRQGLADFLARALPGGSQERLQRLAQSIVDVLAPGDKERTLYENFLVGARNLPTVTKATESDRQQNLF